MVGKWELGIEIEPKVKIYINPKPYEHYPMLDQRKDQENEGRRPKEVWTKDGSKLQNKLNKNVLKNGLT